MDSPLAAEYRKLFKPPVYEGPTAHETETVGYVRGIVDSTRLANRQLIKDAAISLAMYSGRQWAVWTANDSMPAGGFLSDVETEEWQVRLVMNQIRPIVDTQTAKATENQPTVTVLPATQDDDDIERARCSESLVQYVWHDQRLILKTREFGQLVFLTGIGYFKVWWDPDGGDLAIPTEEERAVLGPLASIIPMRPPPEEDNVPDGGEFVADADVVPLFPNGEPQDPDVADLLGQSLARENFPEELTDGNGEIAEGIPEPPPRREGGVRIEVRSCFEVHVDPGASDIASARYAFDEASVHIDDVAARWPKGRYCTPDTSIDEDSWRRDLDTRSTARHSSKNRNLDRVRVIEYFERPSLRHPKGRYLVVANNRLLDEKDYLPTGDLPFVAARHMPLPRRLAGDGTPRDLIPLQIELNTRISQDIEAANLIVANKWLVAEGSIENDEIDASPGEIIRYNPMLPPPRPVAAPPMNPANRTIAIDLLEAMKRISLVNDIVFGEVPSGLSGRAIGFLQDQMASTLGPTVREIERALEDVASRILRFWRDYAPARKTLRVVGRDRRVEVLEFHSGDIRSTDVHIEHNSMLPRGLNYRREQILQTGAQGFAGDVVNDPKVRSQLLRAMEFGDLEVVQNQQTRERRYANEENEWIAAGDASHIPMPLARENHDVHIDELNDWLTSVDYRNASPLAQQIGEWHFAWHYYFKSMLAANVPFWTLAAQLFPAMPPAPNAPPPPGAQGPQAPERPPVDAFGPDPAELPPPGAPQLPPELLAALGNRAEAAPEIKRDLPTDQPHGPGVGPWDGGQ
jgi:hypothetical protein